MKHPWSNKLFRALPPVLAAAIAGCATTEMTAQWKDPAYGSALSGSRVLVLCQARDDTLRRVCDMAMAGRENGATAIASTQLMLSDFAVVNPGPQVGFGLGGGSGGGYRGGGFSVGGIGLSFPVGGATTTRSLGSSTSLVDLASGAVIWSGSATTSASGDVTSQVGALTEVTIEALRKVGLIR